MDDSKFREYTINGTKIEFKPVTEIFEEVETPYLIVGESRGGKTTFCADILDKYGSEASNIYYMSATTETIGKDPMKAIPKIFRKEPTYENLKNIWETIKLNNKNVNITTEELRTLLPKIYNEKDNQIINDEYSEFYEKTKQELIEKAKYIENYKLDIDSELDIICVEILTRLILSGINLYGTAKLNNDDILIIQSLMSTPQKTILLIDDVSAQFEKIKKSKEKVDFIDSDGKIQTLNIGDAYKSLLTDIFTTGRRFNAIICIFVHSWNIIENKDLLRNFILCDKKSAESIKALRTVATSDLKDIISDLSKYIFNNYKYHFILLKGNEISVTKADLIKSSPEFDELNDNLIKAYNTVKNKLNYKSTKKTETVDDKINDLI